MDYLPTAPPDTGHLSDFLARPVLIYQFAWTSGLAPNLHIDPWALFLNDAAVQNKVTNFARLRATLNVEIQVNGTPFHYGSVLASYEPSIDSRRSVDGDWRQHSCLQHGFVDPTASASVFLKCPFTHPANWIDLTLATGAQVGVLNLDTVVGLRSSSGTIDPVNIMVYAWMTDVQLAFPTNYAVATFTAQAKKVTIKGKKGSQKKDEYTMEPNQGLISRPANAIANFAAHLTSVPYIGPFATATQIGATAVGTIAGMFGYSRPTNLDSTGSFVAMPHGPLATTDMAVNSVPLTLGSKSELSIDPKIIGYPTSQDELTVASIACTPTLMDIFGIPVSQPGGTLITSLNVDPMTMSTNSLGAGVNAGMLELSSLAFATMPFRYWAGTIKFRFQIICSKFHRGRLRFTYSPDPLSIFNVSLNTTYNHIVDISPGKELEIEIPYASWRPALEVTDPSASHFLTNGKLHVSIQNEVSAPDSTSNVELLAWVYAGDDYKVFEPYGKRFQFCDMVPQAEHGSEDNQRTFESVKFFDSDLGPGYDLMLFGDPVKSFRPLLKRFSPTTASYQCRAAVGYTDADELSKRFIRFPMYPQRTGRVTYGTTVVSGGGTDANVNYNHLLNWLEPSFLAKRGSFRWSLDSNMSIEAYSRGASLVNVTREDSSDVRVWENRTLVALGVGDDQGLAMETAWGSGTNNVRGNAFDGLQTFFPDNDLSGHNPEVQMPFYYPYRFATHLGTDTGEYYPRQAALVTSTIATPNNSVPIHCNAPVVLYGAVGEDFTMNGYLGPPRWYYFDYINYYDCSSSYGGTVRNGPLP